MRVLAEIIASDMSLLVTFNNVIFIDIRPTFYSKVPAVLFPTPLKEHSEHFA
jgi:hypothetical protein